MSSGIALERDASHRPVRRQQDHDDHPYSPSRTHQANGKTTIGAEAFIGSDSQLVAPVSIGTGAYVASGSSITEDVPDGALAIARARQTNKPDRAERLRARLEAAAREAQKKDG